jgi:hypothetical protein
VQNWQDTPALVPEWRMTNAVLAMPAETGLFLLKVETGGTQPTGNYGARMAHGGEPVLFMR